jgi:predicted aspartyl protease
MLRGRFGIATTAPYLEAYVTFPRLKRRGFVSLLVDTGADGTVLMPADGMKLNVDYKVLTNPTISQGVGGVAKSFSEQAVLAFSDNRYVYSYLLDIQLLAPTRQNHHLPSLLGRDILNQWRGVIDYGQRRLAFTPRQWDLRQKI